MVHLHCLNLEPELEGLFEILHEMENLYPTPFEYYEDRIDRELVKISKKLKELKED